MHAEYGLKRSPALRICKATALLLFFTFIVSFILIFTDIKAFDSLFQKELTEEDKEELLSSSSFRMATRLVYTLETNEDAYGSGYGIKAITRIISQTRNSYGSYYNRVFWRVEKTNGNDLYFEFKKDFELTTAEIYNSHAKSSTNKYLLSEESFRNAQLAYINELIQGDDAADFIYGLKKDEVASKKYYKALLNAVFGFSEIREHANEIVSICAGSPYDDEEKANQLLVLRVTLDNDDAFFYIKLNGIWATTDSSAYASYAENEVNYTDYDLEVLFKESGIWQ